MWQDTLHKWLAKSETTLEGGFLSIHVIKPAFLFFLATEIPVKEQQQEQNDKE